MANIKRWEGRSDLMSLRDAMNQLFEESMVWPRSFLNGMGGLCDGLAVDVYETKENVVLKASIPGAKPEDIDISVMGDVLTIKGEFKSETETEEANVIRRERRTGSFTRSLTLPTSVDADNATAEFENGVLKLTLPKRPEARAKTIEIKAGSTEGTTK